MTPNLVKINYFTDVLCVWAYIAQIRLEELQKQFPEQIAVQHHFINLFANTEQRIGIGWQTKGGYAGFHRHVSEICEKYDHYELNKKVWLDCHPQSSANSHLFLYAAKLCIEAQQTLSDKAKNTLFEKLLWEVRCGFFQRAEDISRLDVLFDIAQQLDLPKQDIFQYIENGRAIALLSFDQELKEKHKIEGSPTYLFNQGRQKLYGNVGYKIIEANVMELLEDRSEHASWC